MQELTITTDKENELFLKEFIFGLKENKLETFKAVFSYFSNGKRIRLDIKSNEERFSASENIIIAECFFNAFINVFKYNYFSKHLVGVGIEPNSEGRSDTAHKPIHLNDVLIKALVMFDKGVDEETVMKEFYKMQGKIVLESFFNFRLIEVKERWDELIEIVSKNCNKFFESDTFLEFLKFLISSLELTENNASVEINSEGEVCYMETTGINAILSLIKAAPKNISLKVNSKNSEKLDLILNLFEGRVEIL